MREYTKPEFSLYKFDIETKLMTGATPTPTPTLGVYRNVGPSTASVDEIPTDVATKVFTQYGEEGENWNWTDK